MGRSSVRRRDRRCSLLARVEDYDATPGSGHRTRGSDLEGVRGGVMIPALQAVCLLLLSPAAGEVETRFVQVLPPPGAGQISPGQAVRPRAVVLIHGLFLHPFSKEHAGSPLLRDWQAARSRMVRELSNGSD